MSSGGGNQSKLEKGKLVGNSVDLLFIGNLEHSEEYVAYSARRKKHEPHTDEILFKRAVKVQMLRIVRPKREIYKKYHSVTQSEKPIRNFEIFYRNVAEAESRYSLLSRTDEMLANPNDDILITAREGVYTDILVIRGFFTKITLCVYGYLLKEDVVRERCPSFGCDVKIERPMPAIIATEKPEAKHSGLLQSMKESVEQGNVNLTMDYVDAWFQGSGDDDHTQIRLISSISEKLQQSLKSLSQTRQPSALAGFRTLLQQLHSDLSKLFRTKHLGLYYPSPFRPSQIPKFLPETLPTILLSCFAMYGSDQYRALQNLRLLLQIPNMAGVFVQISGLDFLFHSYVTSQYNFSTLRVLILEVLLVLAQFPPAVKYMVSHVIEDSLVYELAREGDPTPELPLLESASKMSLEKERHKEKNDSRSRSRNKRDKSRDKDKKKKDKDRDRDSDKKKDKKRRKDSDDSDDSRDRDRNKNRSKKKDKKGKEKDKKKSRSRSKSKTDKKSRRQKDKDPSLSKQGSQIAVAPLKLPKKPEKPLTFYQILLQQTRKDQPYKQSLLLKLLIEQLTQSVTKNTKLSEQVAHFSPFLREIRYLFNPSRELVNSKTLKVFASFQPFLNIQQSQGVENCEYTSQALKINQPKKYGIDIMVYKVINAISGKIAFAEFDEEFIIFMSELLLADYTTTVGLNRMVEALKTLSLRKNEAVVIMLEDYIYKVLLEDDGMATMLYLDQIFNSIMPISRSLKQQRIAFSKDLFRSTKFLLNYALPFEYILKQNILKMLSEAFLKTFKYVHIEASRFLQFEQVSCNLPVDLNLLRENFNLGNFYELLPEQPLLEIDVYLKIFCVLCKYNRTIWTSYYENKLTNGFAVLFNRINFLAVFMLRKSVDMEYAATELQQRNKLVANYLSVANHLLILFVDKMRYETAFNELPPEDTFEDIELFVNCLDLFEHAFGAYFDPELRISGYTKKCLKRSMLLITELFSQFSESVELSGSKQRQNKLKRLLDRIYILHFQRISSRAQVFALYSLLIQTSRGATNEHLCEYFLSRFQMHVDVFDADLSLLPNNQRTVLQNLFRYNVYRSDKLVKNGLVHFLKTLLGRMQLNVTTALYRLVDAILRELLQELRSPSNNQHKLMLQKVLLFLQVLEQVCDDSLKNWIIINQLDDQILKILRQVEEQRAAENADPANLVLLLKIRNIILRLNIIFIDCSRTMRPDLPPTLGFDTPQVQTQQGLFKLMNSFISQTALLFEQQLAASTDINIVSELLTSTKLCLQVCIASSKSPVTQTVLLYGDYVENAYRPECMVSLQPLIALMFSNKIPEQFTNRFVDILQTAAYVLASLTQHPKTGIYNCERRKVAIRALLGEKPTIEQFINHRLFAGAYCKYLSEYFSQPSIEIRVNKQPQVTKNLDQVFKQARDLKFNKSTKTPQDKMFDNFSSTLFEIISEGERVAKARYKLVCPEWRGGDCNNAYQPLAQVECEKILEQLLDRMIVDRDVLATAYPMQKTRPNVEYNELVLLYTKKQYPERVKKPAPWTINLKQIPTELKAPIQEPPRQVTRPPVITPPPQYKQPAYIVQNPTPPPAPSYPSMYPAEPVYQPSPPISKYAPVAPPSMPAGDSRLGRGMQMQYPNPEMMYSYNPYPQAHMQPSYAGYGGMYNPNQPMKMTAQQEYDYRMMIHNEMAMRQQQQQQQAPPAPQPRGDTRVVNINTLMQHAIKLIRDIKKEPDEGGRRRLETELEQLVHSYPDLQRKLQELGGGK